MGPNFTGKNTGRFNGLQVNADAVSKGLQVNLDVVYKEELGHSCQRYSKKSWVTVRCGIQRRVGL